MPRVIINPVVPEPILGPPAAPPVSLNRTPPPVSVYIETAKDSDEFVLAPNTIDWSSVKRELDDADDVATLIVRSLDARNLTTGGFIGTEHLTHILLALHPDRRVRIAMSQGADAPIILFQGYPQSTSPSWSERHQAVTCQCLSEGNDRLRTTNESTLVGRFMRLEKKKEYDDALPDLFEVQTLPPVFNPDGKPNMLPQRLAITDTEGNSHILFAFDEDNLLDANDQAYWNVADAIRYVAHFYGRKTGVSVEEFMTDTDPFVGLVGTADNDDPFARLMTARLHNANVQSMSPAQALKILCDKSGLHFEVVPQIPPVGPIFEVTFYLRVFAVLENEAEETATLPGRLMVSPRVLDIPRDAPFGDYTQLTPTDVSNRNEARQAQLTLDRRGFNKSTFIGGAKEYQTTLLLRPLWLPHEHVDNLDTPAKKEAALAFWEEAYDEEEDEGGNNPVGKKVYRTEYHGKHPDFADVADIWRKWGFPDDAEYMNDDGLTSQFARDEEPWASPLYWSPFDSTFEHLVYAEGDIGGSIPKDDVKKWVPRRRPFLPTIQRRMLASSSRTPIVWLNFRATDPLTALADPHWIRFTGSVKIDAQRAALWFIDDDLWSSPSLRSSLDDDLTGMIPAYLGVQDDGSFAKPHFFVAVTCTVQGDLRMSHSPVVRNSFTRERAKTVDLGFDRFLSRSVIDHPNEQFDLVNEFVEPDPEFRPRDDASPLEKYADRVGQEMADESISGSWEAPYIKTDIRLGDSFSGVDGLGIAFSVFPEVKAIEWTKGPDEGFRTVYHLTDLRHAPELGVE